MFNVTSAITRLLQIHFKSLVIHIFIVALIFAFTNTKDYIKEY